MLYYSIYTATYTPSDQRWIDAVCFYILNNYTDIKTIAYDVTGINFRAVISTLDSFTQEMAELYFPLFAVVNLGINQYQMQLSTILANPTSTMCPDNRNEEN